jgi:hypothetical protein
MALSMMAPFRAFSPVAMLSLVVLAASAAACGTTSTPRARVARDLGCTPEETTVTKLPPDEQSRPDMERWTVRGCGRAAVYLCTIPVRDCWREGPPAIESAAVVP